MRARGCICPLDAGNVGGREGGNGPQLSRRKRETLP